MTAKVKAPPVCLVCGKPATETVDGQPSCSKHVELIYENQVEDQTAKELGYKVGSKR